MVLLNNNLMFIQ